MRLGIIGMSEGNGHPYSWAAICNGYNREAMQRCPFPAIPRYLAERQFPRDALPGARVTCVWTQERTISESIAAASNIDEIVPDFTDMIGRVDGVLLARDDAENHAAFARPFLEAGLPVYIDKPFAIRVEEANQLLAYQKYPWQIFTCSALRYSAEFDGTGLADEIGEIVSVDARVPKSWEKYAIHVIEPLLSLSSLTAGEIKESKVLRGAEIVRLVFTTSSGAHYSIAAFGSNPSDISIRVSGTCGIKNMVFADSFTAFRRALEEFTTGVRSRTIRIPRTETLNAISIIERGLT